MITLAIIETTNYILALAVISLALMTAIILYDMHTKHALQKFIERWGIVVALFITSVGTILTLIYSEIFGIEPCGFCWLERMMLWPQVLIFLIVLSYKKTCIVRYGIAFSSVGLFISLYHHYIQMGGSQFIKCPAMGAGADCAKRFLFEFGFVTFPFMGAILFAFLIVFSVYILKIK